MEKNNKSLNSNSKRPFFEEEDSNKQSSQKRVRFPKGRKIKPGDEAYVAVEPTRVDKVDDASERIAFDARQAAKERAKERAKGRNKITAELLNEQSSGVHDISAAEVNYEGSETMVDEGTPLEPFNLDQEREEGYFDADGNFVEYVRTNEDKDAWLDSVEVDPRLAEKCYSVHKAAEEIPDLSSAEIGQIKRYIADLLEPEETVLQALRRMKGNSNNRKEKMSPETKLLFDRLTECAMKLLENGDYNVYHEKQEVFKREAEGYERLAWAKGQGTSVSATNGEGKDFYSQETNSGVPSVVPNVTVASATAEMTTGDGGDEAFDIFAEDDGDTTIAPSTDGTSLPLSYGSNTNGLSSEISTTDSTVGALQNDYEFDESSGYYYSSSLGYYYDPSTGLYCYASSGQWYSYNEDTGSYDEFQEAAAQAVVQ